MAVAAGSREKRTSPVWPGRQICGGAGKGAFSERRFGGGFDCGDYGGVERLGLLFCLAELGFFPVEFLFAFVEVGLTIHDLSFADFAELLAVALPGGRELAFGGDGAELGVEDDFIDGGGGDAVGVVGFFGQVEACDLQAVEKQAGAAGIEVA